MTSRNLRDRLDKELLTNVSIRVEQAGGPESFRVMGRGELATRDPDRDDASRGITS